VTVTYRVWAQYDAQREGEINVKIGDMIKVDEDKDEAGESAVWGVKTLKSGEIFEGWVPKWCLTMVSNLDFSQPAPKRRGRSPFADRS